jgi:branched-chain amino acid transport system substrate-binding protein
VAGELPTAAPLARSLGAAPAARGKALAKYAARDLKATRAVVLTDSNDVVAGAVGAAFRKEWPASGSSSADEWTFSNDKDAAELVARTARARPEVVVLACRPEQFRTLRDSFAASGFKGLLIYGGEDDGPMAGLTDAGPEIYLATVYCPEKLTERGKEFARRYEAEYHEPPDLHAAAAYDAAWLLLGAMAEAASPTAAALRDQLGRTMSFETVTGPVAWKGHETRRALFLLHDRRGQRHLVQTIEPQHD